MKRSLSLNMAVHLTKLMIRTRMHSSREENQRRERGDKKKCNKETKRIMKADANTRVEMEGLGRNLLLRKEEENKW